MAAVPSNNTFLERNKTSHILSKNQDNSLMNTVLLCGYSLLFVAGVLGNTIVLITTCVRKRKSNKMRSFKMLIISLALADLIGSFFAPFVMITHLVKSFSWGAMGNVGCKIFSSMTLLGSLASAWTIVAIALSRSRIFKKISFTVESGGANTMWRILLLWFFSIAVTSSYTAKIGMRNGKCLVDWTPTHRFICSILFLSFTNIIPIIILCWAHLKSVINFRHSIKETQTKLGIKRNKQVQKITNMFSLITVTFFCFITPFTCLYLVIAYTKFTRQHLGNIKTYMCLYHGLYLLSCCNFVVNPYLYASKIKFRPCFDKLFASIKHSFCDFLWKNKEMPYAL